MCSITLSFRRFPLIVFAALFFALTAIPVPVSSQGVDSAYFFPTEVVGQQVFTGCGRVTLQNTCYRLESFSWEWQGDTLMGVFNTRYNAGQPCLMLFTRGEVVSPPYYKPPGTYYLQVTGVLRTYLGNYLMDTWVYTLSDMMDVHACGPCVAGDIDHDAEVTIADITFLAGYMFKSGFPPPCEDEGDPNGDGSEDISDLTYLVKYMFKEGTSPVCP